MAARRGLRWHLQRWLLNLRGWDGDLAMRVLDLDTRLDRKSVLDLLDEARPRRDRRE